MAEYLNREVCLSILRAKANMAVLMDAAPYFEKAAQMLEKLPAADVAPVVYGRWIEDHDYLKCPECGVMVNWDFTFFDDIGDWNYCPNCGAKMDGGNS